MLERPPVDDVARRMLRARGYGDRVSVVAGDMFAGLPDGHDLHLLSHTLHDWDEERVRDILEGSFATLAPGGWLVDHDTHLNRDKTGPLPVAELEAFLVQVGFADVEQRPAAGDRSIVMARKPA